MANSFGASARQVLVSVLIGLLVIAFAVWGINDVFSGNSRNAVLSVGGNDITTQEFSRALEQELAVLAQEEGRTLTYQEAYDRGIPNRVLQRLLTQKVVEVDATDLGIGVNGKSARDYLAQMDVFKDELTGKYSRNKVLEVLARQTPPIPLQTFETDLINELRQRQTIPAINGGVQAPLQFAEETYQYLTEQRKAKVLTITANAVDAPEDPTDDELRSYIDANKVRFTAPEYRKFTMIRLESYDFDSDVSVTDEELKARYDYKMELGEIGSPERRSLVQITANSKEQAEDAAKELQQGLSPSEISNLFGLIQPVTYDNVTPEAILDPETSIAAFEMNVADTRVILGSFGNWYALQVTKITPANKPDMADMKNELSADLIKAKAEEKLYDVSSVIEDQLVEGKTLEEAAEAAAFPYASFDFIDRTGTTQDGLRMSGFRGLEGVAMDEKILIEIFTHDQGFETDMFETSTGGWATLRVDEVIESKLRPFEDVREQALALWKAEKTEDALNARVAELASRAREGESLDKIASDFDKGVSVEDVIFLRSAPNDNIGGQLTVKLLKGQIGDIEYGPGSLPASRQVAELTAIVPNSDSLAGEYADMLQNQLSAAIIGDLNNAYQKAVTTDHPVKEFPDKIMQTLGLDPNP